MSMTINVTPGVKQARYLRVLADQRSLSRRMTGAKQPESLAGWRIARLVASPRQATSRDNIEVQPAMWVMQAHGWVEPGEVTPRGGKTWRITDLGIAALEIAEGVR